MRGWAGTANAYSNGGFVAITTPYLSTVCHKLGLQLWAIYKESRHKLPLLTNEDGTGKVCSTWSLDRAGESTNTKSCDWSPKDGRHHRQSWVLQVTKLSHLAPFPVGLYLVNVHHLMHEYISSCHTDRVSCSRLNILSCALQWLAISTEVKSTCLTLVTMLAMVLDAMRAKPR